MEEGPPGMLCTGEWGIYRPPGQPTGTEEILQAWRTFLMVARDGNLSVQQTQEVGCN